MYNPLVVKSLRVQGLGSLEVAVIQPLGGTAICLVKSSRRVLQGRCLERMVAARVLFSSSLLRSAGESRS